MFEQIIAAQLCTIYSMWLVLTRVFSVGVVDTAGVCVWYAAAVAAVVVVAVAFLAAVGVVTVGVATAIIISPSLLRGRRPLTPGPPNMNCSYLLLNFFYLTAFYSAMLYVSPPRPVLLVEFIAPALCRGDGWDWWRGRTAPAVLFFSFGHMA